MKRYVWCFLLLACACGAAPITYTFNAIGSGSLNGVDFNDAAFTITATGDTQSAFFTGIQYWFANPVSAPTLDITGFSPTTFEFSQPSLVLVGQSPIDVVFIGQGFNPPDIGTPLGIGDFGLASYGLQDAYGPTSHLYAVFITAGSGFSTAAGEFILNSSSQAGGSFQATIGGTPEPGALSLVGLGVLALVACRRIRAKSSLRGAC